MAKKPKFIYYSNQDLYDIRWDDRTSGGRDRFQCC